MVARIELTHTQAAMLLPAMRIVDQLHLVLDVITSASHHWLKLQGGKHETRPHEDSSTGLYWQYQLTSISPCRLVKEGKGTDNQLVL